MRAGCGLTGCRGRAESGVMLIAGIDEAGYGPRLGPMCVGFCAFEVERFDAKEEPVDLWGRLGPEVGRWGDRKTATVLVDDSKKLKRVGKEPLRELERSCLSHLGLMGVDVGSDVAALGVLGVEVPAVAAGEVELGTDAAGRGVLVNVVKRRMAAAGVELVALGVDAVSAAGFNEAWRRTRSKAAMELEMIGPRLRWVWERCREEGALVSLDRLGGRTRYKEALVAAVPGAEVDLVRRDDERVFYRLHDAEREMFVEVLVGGDGKRYCVALASVAAKWSRELVMGRFNRVFGELAPELKPTAGYGTDANRWIREARAELGRGVVDPLVRLA